MAAETLMEKQVVEEVEVGEVEKEEEEEEVEMGWSKRYFQPYQR